MGLTPAFLPSPKPATRPVARIIVQVDAHRCTGCGLCLDACVDKALTVNDIAVVDARLCVGCGGCVSECPNDALSLGR